MLLLWLLVLTAGSSTQTVSVTPQPIQVQPRDPTIKPPVGTGSISGRVVAADTGAPMRRAQVQLMGSGPPRMAFTDAEGRYSFKGLPPASYMVSVNPGNHRGGYLAAGYGVQQPIGPASSSRPKPIELADGQQVDNINVSLTRGGAIIGTVTDAAGEPVARAQVGALFARRGMDPTPIGANASTDDLGQFRLFGLAPGEYVVFADSRSDNFGGPYDVQGEATGFATTFAPAATSIAEAMRVRLPRGGQASVDIRLLETRVFTIRGTVISSSGETVRNTSINVSRVDSPSMMFTGGYGASVQPDGTFVVRNVRPGQYDLVARYMPVMPGPTSGPEAMDRTEMAMARVDVGAADVDGVTLVTERGATVVGQIVFEDGQSEGRRVQVFAQNAERRTMWGSPRIEVKDAAFTMRNAFGRLLIRANAMTTAKPPDGSSESLGVKAVLLNGKDITDEPHVFTNADSGRLQIVITANAPGLEGVVTDDSGKPVQDCTVVLFGDDPETWRPNSSMVRISRPSPKENKFRLRGLREGRYRIVALQPDFMLNMSTPDPQLFEALSKLATAVVLNAGETRTVDLKVTPFQQ